MNNERKLPSFAHPSIAYQMNVQISKQQQITVQSSQYNENNSRLKMWSATFKLHCYHCSFVTWSCNSALPIGVSKMNHEKYWNPRSPSAFPVEFFNPQRRHLRVVMGNKMKSNLEDLFTMLPIRSIERRENRIKTRSSATEYANESYSFLVAKKSSSSSFFLAVRDIWSQKPLQQNMDMQIALIFNCHQLQDNDKNEWETEIEYSHDSCQYTRHS